MTALLRIIGCLWLVLVAAGHVFVYGVMWIWQGVTTAAANPPPSTSTGMLIAIASVMPGLILIGLATWLDRRRAR